MTQYVHVYSFLEHNSNLRQLHERDEILSMWGPDAPVVPQSTALRHLIIATLGFVSFGFFAKFFLIPDRPAVPRDYPFSGLVAELGGLEDNKVCYPTSMDKRPC